MILEFTHLLGQRNRLSLAIKVASRGIRLGYQNEHYAEGIGAQKSSHNDPGDMGWAAGRLLRSASVPRRMANDHVYVSCMYQAFGVCITRLCVREESFDTCAGPMEASRMMLTLADPAAD